ncbi:MAG: hypothetical protein AAGJ81_12355 [Verrucomicrobiota bacterium]
MKTVSPRERVMVLLLPSAIILLIYGFFVVQPLFKEKEELERQRTVLELRLPTQAERSTVRRQLLELQREVSTIRGSDSESSKGRSVFSPNEVLEASAELEELMEVHGVILMSESRAEAQDRRAYERLLDKRPGSEISRLELAGTFAGISALVSSLDQTGPALLPVAIEMDAGMQGETDLRRWNLWICR